MPPQRPPLVEEIKTTRLDPQRIDPAQNPAHWAQALLYAHMLAQELGRGQVKTRLVYMDLSGAHKDREEVLDAAALEDHFLAAPCPMPGGRPNWRRLGRKMLPTLRALSFPYPDYRPGQRELAAQTYLALKRHNALLAQAPTGIGKTAAVLFRRPQGVGRGPRKPGVLSYRPHHRPPGGRVRPGSDAPGWAVATAITSRPRKSCVR